MNLVRWTNENPLAGVVLTVVAASVAFLSGVGFLAWFVAALAATVSGASVPLGFLGVVLALGTVGGGAVAAVAAVGVGYAVVGRVGTRLRTGVAGCLGAAAERYPVADMVVDASGLADRLDPRDPIERAEDRIASHADRYVAGDIDEPELERRIDAVLESEGVGETAPTADPRLADLEQERGGRSR